MDSNFYNIDFKKLVFYLMPSRLRNGINIVFISLLTKPIAKLNISFLQFRKLKLYELGINSQVCFLQKLLNDRFDYTQRRIIISEPIDTTPYYLFKKGELKPVFINKKMELKPKYTYTNGETISPIDFIVQVPKLLVYNNSELEILIKKYRLPYKAFKIITY
jgi:hypothetical protein